MLSPFLTQGLTHLRQPRLLQPICENMVGDNGLPQASLLAGIDRLLCEDAVGRIAEWEMPSDLPVGTRREDRWRTVSSLQKAIRRGDVYAAMVAAHAAHSMDAPYLRRRLAVIAVEDVCLGNLYAVAATLALVGDKASRRLIGEQKTAVWLAAQLAAGWKDRSACNLCVVVDLDRALHETMHAWKHLPDAVLSAKSVEMSRPVKERMLAAWLLAGTKRFWNINVPRDNERPRWSLMRVMVQSGMPLLFYWLADRSATRHGDCMFVAFLPIWQMLSDAGDGNIELRRGDLPPDPGVGSLLACAYDMHTREGRIALGRFLKSPAIADALGSIANDQDRLGALYNAAFAVEGGKLDLRVSTPAIDDVHFAAIRHDLAYFGLGGAERQAALLRAVHENLGLLNRYRQQIAATTSPAHIPGLTTQSLTTLPVQPALKLYQAHKLHKLSPPVILPDVEFWESSAGAHPG